MLRRFSRKREEKSAVTVVGTEARALENLTRNRKSFSYPGDFVTRIEQTLLYSMIDAGPKVYPDDAILQYIDEEPFLDYIFLEGTRQISYGQLCAILSLSTEKFPPLSNKAPSAIPEKLCRTVLNSVVQYAEDHNLEREEEVKEILDDINDYFNKKSDSAEAKASLSFFVGYAATILTANPFPMLVGWSVMLSKANKIDKERENVSQISKEGRRKADVETTGLMDEAF